MERKICLDDFCEDVVGKILSHVALKPRTRLKLVSKDWCAIITRLRHSKSNPLTTSMCMGTILYPPLSTISDTKIFYEATLHIEQNQGKEECIFQNPHPFNYDNPPLFLGSCNGLLLYILNWVDVSIFYDVQHVFFCVSNPVLKQFLVLPPIPHHTGFVSASLFFDGSSQQHFKVMCNFWDKSNPATVKCYLFNSETHEWRDYEARIVNPSAILSIGLRGKLHTFFFKGKLYYRLNVCIMMIYDFETQLFKLLPLETWPVPGFCIDGMWESDGCLFYCKSKDEGLDIFTFAGDDDEKMLWKRRITREELLGNIEEEGVQVPHNDDQQQYGDGEEVEVVEDIHPIMFDDELQILYLRLGRTIYCYSFETGRSTNVRVPCWVFNDGSKTLVLEPNMVFPYNFERGRKAKLV